ncbi:MAG: cytochrome c biogenesis CcdA family protein [Candidatus Woesearchaeota archaeon]
MWFTKVTRHLFYLIILLVLIGASSIAFAKDVCLINETFCLGNLTQNSTTTSESTNTINRIQNDSICIAYFYGEGCSNCAKIQPFIESVERKYGDKIHIYKYEVYRDLKNYQLYNKLCSVQNIPLEKRGIPLIAINDKYLMGVESITKNLEAEIENTLASGKHICPIEGEMTCHLSQEEKESEINPVNPQLKTGITLPLIIGTGLVDGINPCAFSVLIFLLTFLLAVSKDTKRMLKAGIAYIVAVYITYFLAGIGLLAAIHITGLSGIIVKIAALLAIIIGLINIKDFFWYGKWFSLKIPEVSKQTIEKLTYRANIPAALVLGFLVAMFELPCTGGVYLAIIAMLANSMTQASAVGYLLLYNLMFVLPLVFIIFLVVKGMKTEHIEEWRQSRKNWMRLILGVVLLMLGVAMLLGLV